MKRPGFRLLSVSSGNVLQPSLRPGVWRMKKTLTMLAFLAALPAGAALADDECSVAMADWQPRAAVLEFAAQSGWTVRRIKIDDGCYEIEGLDAEGREIEATIHPATFQLIEFEVEYDDDDDDDH